MRKVTLVIIVSHIWKDHVMHNFDLFESWKTLMEDPLAYTTALGAGETIVTGIAQVRQVIEAPGEHRVIAIFMPGVVEGAWCDLSIVEVSTGKKFGKFKDVLQSLSYAGPPPLSFPPLSQLDPAALNSNSHDHLSH